MKPNGGRSTGSGVYGHLSQEGVPRCATQALPWQRSSLPACWQDAAAEWIQAIPQPTPAKPRCWCGSPPPAPPSWWTASATGRVTPADVSAFAQSQESVVTLTLTGYHPWHGLARKMEGMTLTLDATLTPSSGRNGRHPAAIGSARSNRLS